MDSFYIPNELLLLIFKAIEDPQTYQRCCMLNNDCKMLCEGLRCRMLKRFAKLVGTHYREGDNLPMLYTRSFLKTQKTDGARARIAYRLPNRKVHGIAFFYRKPLKRPMKVFECKFFMGVPHGYFEFVRYEKSYERKEWGQFHVGKLHGEVMSNIGGEEEGVKYHHKIEIFDKGRFLKRTLYSEDGTILSEITKGTSKVLIKGELKNMLGNSSKGIGSIELE